ncbi:MAG: alpha/beta hydrolase [Sphingomonadales bacterium]|nr:alpha/beta hydrolase [Sphingomonadales bacterium]
MTVSNVVEREQHWFAGDGGRRLAATLHGSDTGTPVVMLGGMGQTRHSWDRAARRIAATGRRAITLDFRGHGESDRAPDGDYSYPRQAADIAAIVAQIGRPIILVGASLGGKLGLAAASLDGPDVICGLVLVDSVPRSNPQGISNVARTFKAGREGYDTLDEAAAELARNRGREPEPGAAEKLRRNMRQTPDGRWRWHWDQSYTDPRHKLGLGEGTAWLDRTIPGLTIPVLLARCELSDVVSDEGAAALQAIVPQMEVETILGARHMLVGDDNEIFADVLLEWLARHPELA